MNNHPPKFFLLFFRWFCHPHLRQPIEGDLMELYEERVSEVGKTKANWMFRWDVIQLFRPDIIKPADGTYRLNSFGVFKHHLKFGWRSIKKSKAFSLINISGLAFGASVCLVMLIMFRYETSFDGHHQLVTRTFRVVQHTQTPDAELFWNTTAYPLAAALRNDFPDFPQVTQTAGPMKRLFSLEKPNGDWVRFEEDHVLFVDEHHTEVFDYEWLAGDSKTALGELNSVVITDRIARKCFGEVYDPSEAIGRTLMLNNKDALVISGVIKNPPANINLKSGMLISFAFFKKHNPYPAANWSGNYQGTTFVVLATPERSVELESSINKWKSKYLNREDDQRISYHLQPLSEIHTETKYGNTPGGYQVSKTTLNVALSVAGFILLIAIVNFINLVTARSSTRSKEVGIRKIIGGQRAVILKQFFVENSLLVVIALALAILMALPSLEIINQALAVIDMQLSLTLSDVFAAAALGLGVVVLASTYPALILSSFKPIDMLKGRGYRPRKGDLSFRRVLTLTQFWIVQLFVISAIIVGLQLQYFQSKDVGFKSEKIVMVPLPDSENTVLFKNALSQKAGLSQISIGSGPPMAVEDFALGTNYWLPQETKREAREAEMKIADSSYFALYDLTLIAGRNFIENKPQFDEFIVNRKMLESLHLTPEEAIGKKLQINEGEATIIGVIDNFHNHSLQNELTPLVFVNWDAFMWRAFVEVPSFASLIQIEEAWQEAFPAAIFNYSFIDDAIAREYLIERLIYKGFNLFSMLVILIGCLGLFGLISFLTLQKTKEVGIRKVLGASVNQILLLFTKEYARLIGVAFVLAAPFVWYFMNEWLAAFRYHIELKPWMFIAGGLLTFAVASLVTVGKSLGVAFSNPVNSLRNE